jgi:hypothetical protein
LREPAFVLFVAGLPGARAELTFAPRLDRPFFAHASSQNSDVARAIKSATWSSFRIIHAC